MGHEPFLQRRWFRGIGNSKFTGPISLDVTIPRVNVKFFLNQGLSISILDLIRLRVKPPLELCYCYE